jgi:ABC-type sugar transport system permease subunit
MAAVVLYPAAELVRASLGRYSITGLRQEFVGVQNYARLLRHDALPGVIANTAVWVGAVVAITLVISLAAAQLLDQRFPGRRVVRWALLVPWAASLIMTAKLFVWIYDYYFGVLNRLLTAAGLLAGPVDWLGDDRPWSRWASSCPCRSRRTSCWRDSRPFPARCTRPRASTARPAGAPTAR